MASAELLTEAMGKICKSQHPWGHSFRRWDKWTLGQALRVITSMISGFIFPGGNWAVLASFLKGLASPESPSGNLSPMGTVKTSHDLEKMQQVESHSSARV